MNKLKAFAFACLISALSAVSACNGNEAPPALSSADAQSEESEIVLESIESSYAYMDTNSFEEKENGLYTSEGFSVVLPNNYIRQENERFALYAVEKDKSVIALLAESFYDVLSAGMDANMPASEYAKLVIEADDGVQATVLDKGGNAYFEYVKEMDGEQYRYFVYAYRGSGAYYLLQFCCNDIEADFYREAFEQIEKSVEIK